MNMYVVVETATNQIVTGAMGYSEAQRHMQKNRMSRNEYSIEMWMPVKREAVKATAPKAAVANGIEFTAKYDKPGKWFVRFPTAALASEVMHSIIMDGYIVTSCPSETWLEIEVTW